MSKRRYPVYQSYRGRTPKWKSGLAIVLVLVILLSCGVIFLQKHMVYDAGGNARLELPWSDQEEPPQKEQEQKEEEKETPEVEIQKPTPKPKPTQAKTQRIQAFAGPLKAADVASASWEDMDSAAVILRSHGAVFFNSSTATVQSVQAPEETAGALQTLTKDRPGTAALFGCFQDSLTARDNVEAMGLKNTGNYIFYDGENQNWLDPSKEGTQKYLGGQLKELAELGFDEAILTEFSFPTAGKLNKIAYPEAGRPASLSAFLTSVRNQLKEAGHPDFHLSVVLTDAAILNGGDDTTGWDLKTLVKETDGIFAVTTPDKVPQLTEAVKAAGGTRFVPIFETMPEAPQGSFLLLPQA